VTPVYRSYTISCQSAILTITLFYIISEIKLDIVRKLHFFHTPHAFDSPLPIGGLRPNIAIIFGTKN